MSNVNKINLSSLGEESVNHRKVTDKQLVNQYINKMKDAKKRGVEFNLSLKRFRQLLSTKRCFYTGKLLSVYNFSIDRLDADVGYIDSNVVACDNNFNSAKGNITLKGIASIIRGMQKKKLRLSNEDFEIRIYAKKKK